MIDKKLGYSPKTQDLLERQCRNIERKDFVLDKKKIKELILKTYDLFGLARPKKIVWCKDIFDKKFLDNAWSEWSVRSIRSAGGARSAWEAGHAWIAWSIGSVGTALTAWTAWNAWGIRDVGSEGSAESTTNAESGASEENIQYFALDCDFDLYIFEFEYCENPDKDRLPNENDKKYLEYCELLMQAKESGLGYRVEWEDILYLIPTPLVLIDDKIRFHSTKKPAIRWKGGKEFYYLQGVNFEKKMWTKIVNDTMTPNEILAIDNIGHRRIAFQYMDKSKMEQLKDCKILDEQTDEYGNAIV